MRLAHLHIRRLLSYEEASHLQELLIQRQFRFKDALRRQPLTSSNTLPPPPTLLTFSTPPTYTVGRRYLASFSSSSTSPLEKQDDGSSPATPYSITPSQILTLTGYPKQLATFHPSSRGGLLTYHGPGQLTCYPILNLRSHGLTPKCYVRLLERSVMATCAAVGVPNTTTTADPGVWIVPSASSSSSSSNSITSSPENSDSSPAGSPPIPPPRKICAVGVQIRRGITGHGIGLNVLDVPAPASYLEGDGDDERVRPAQGYLSWGFGRIVACGLEGKGVTWLSQEGLSEEIVQAKTMRTSTAPTTAEEAVASVFADELASALDGVDGVMTATEEDLLAEC